MLAINIRLQQLISGRPYVCKIVLTKQDILNTRDQIFFIGN